MNTDQLFDDCVSKIESAYKDLGHKLGWRFLSCPKANFNVDQKIALITLNPGGDEDDSDEYPQKSSENGSAYVVESWGGKPAGKEGLQKQARCLFKGLALRLDMKSLKDELLHQSLSAHFIPFRSPNFAELHNKSRSLEFSKELWTTILDTIYPKLIIVIGREVFDRFSEILREQNNCPINSYKMPTGWGKDKKEIKADISEYSDGIVVCQLPHLSRFSIFDRGKPEPDKILDQITKSYMRQSIE